jgi:phage-related minor tail protein
MAHANNLATLYAHMQRILVSVGQMVGAGQQIGEMGSTGFSTGPHLHFEVWQNGQHVHPGRYVPLAEGGIINEPVSGLGLRTGTRYLIGEAGPEAVIPLNGMGGSGVTVNIQNPTIIAQPNRSPDSTLEDVAWATTEALRRRGLR